MQEINILSDYFSNISEAEFLTSQILYEKAFTPEECVKIIAFAKNLPESEASVNYGHLDYSVRKTKVKFIEVSPETFWIDHRIMAIAEQANKKFYKYKIHSLAELQFLEYSDGGHFDWHMDLSQREPFKFRKISLSVFLSDPRDYEGGKLEWIPSIKDITQEQGKIVFFPTFKYHRVSPVTKGTRYSLVAWIYGK